MEKIKHNYKIGQIIKDGNLCLKYIGNDRLVDVTPEMSIKKCNKAKGYYNRIIKRRTFLSLKDSENYIAKGMLKKYYSYE